MFFFKRYFAFLKELKNADSVRQRKSSHTSDLSGRKGELYPQDFFQEVRPQKTSSIDRKEKLHI